MALTQIQAAAIAADSIDETKLADNSIDSEHYNDGSIDNEHLADDAVGVAELSATGTASSSTFLRGDNSWVTPTDTNTQLSTEQVQDIVGGMFTGNTETNITATYEDSDGTIDLVSTDTNTTYSVGDGGLTTNDFTNADHTKLDGIAASANNYVHPNHSGEVTSTADGATVIADDIVDEANLKVSNAPTNGYFLSAQSGNTGGLTWAEAGGGGTFTYNSTSESVYGLGTSGEDLTNASNQRCTLIGFAAGKEVTDGPGNTAVGAESLFKCTTGDYNTVLGHYSMATLTTGNNNVAIGNSAMSAGVTTGDNNIAIGLNAGNSLTSGGSNVLIGKEAGKALTTESAVTAVGWQALKSNTTGIRNTAVGWNALLLTSTGSQNTTVGYGAGNQISSGSQNTFMGHEAGNSTNTGPSNTVIGYNALYYNTTGDSNVCIGRQTGEDVSTGSYNTFVGKGAGHEATTAGNNVAYGINSGGTLTTGSYNVFIGHEAGYNQVDSTDNGMYIARDGSGPGNAACWIHGNSSGQLYNGTNSSSWNTSSDRRIKKNIADNTKGLTEINQLRVANFEYKTQSEIDMNEFPLAKSAAQVVVGEGNAGVHTGVIAQEIESILPECVVSGARGVKTVSTDPVLWALVNAVKELSAKVTALEGG